MFCRLGTMSRLLKFKEAYNFVVPYFGISPILNYPQRKMKKSAINMYLSCAETVDYPTFFKEFKMPDTFFSWFLVLELHMWMVMTRLSPEAHEGRFTKERMVEMMWEDVEIRMKKLARIQSAVRKREFRTITFHFGASLLGYDEGILSNDRVLAGALWRNLFEMRPIDAEMIAQAVDYVHKQNDHLAKFDRDFLFSDGLFTFLPFHGNKLTAKEETALAHLKDWVQYRK